MVEEFEVLNIDHEDGTPSVAVECAFQMNQEVFPIGYSRQGVIRESPCSA